MPNNSTSPTPVVFTTQVGQPEELLDDLPVPINQFSTSSSGLTSSTSLTSLSSASQQGRVPPLAVVKNSIRVNIGCNSKK